MMLFEYLTILYRLMGCTVFEDLSALCHSWSWGVPW